MKTPLTLWHLNSSRLRIQLGVAFSVGILTGAALTGILSMKASRVYLEIVTAGYTREQEARGDECWESGKLSDAVHYYVNVVDAISSNGIYQSGTEDIWSVGFPVYAIILNSVAKNADVEGRGKRFQEGVVRGKLGMVLESLGRNEEAQREYSSALRPTGMDDLARLESFIKGMTGK
jgi:hypothetical protein